jgi:hypothetical protein
MQIEAASLDLERKNSLTLTTYCRTIVALKSAKGELAQKERKPNATGKRHFNNLKQEYTQASHAYYMFMNARRELREQAKKAEKDWTHAMRKVNHEHDCLLAKAGLFSKSTVVPWTEKDYSWKATLSTVGSAEIPSEVDSELGDSNNISSQSRVERAPKARQGEQHDELQDQITRNKNLVCACKDELRHANQHFDRYRRSYDHLFKKYVAQHPGQPKTDLSQEDGPRYFSGWQERIQAVRAAEEALIQAKEKRDAQLAAHRELQQANVTEDAFDETLVTAGCHYPFDDEDRNRVMAWIATFPDDMDPAVLSIEDSRKLWKKPEYCLVARENFAQEENDEVEVDRQYPTTRQNSTPLTASESIEPDNGDLHNTQGPE